ncbi:methyltransferase domain-containing protein [Amycolatopsis sp. OK19-0408]|uniref:Methyltransferase domain-containing protein n=1 Tax=Amycolatopsis iheyensis TaxID=2945988 RepID=A0A9X2NEW3_9PSEU|nr:methyltransferase domain-containing protein [Amycolatopsis iheyensis]MCR6487424.1 methyltransferase domain-containing protein [Amycolatopsis iheyensis]
MDGLELYDLARRLMYISSDAIPDRMDPQRQSGVPDTSVPIDEQLAAAAGIEDPAEAKELIATLEGLERRLSGSVSPDPFDWYTAGTPPWDTGRPQTAIRELAEAGAFRGRVLDIGCGTGENVLMIAALGLTATGFDLSGTAIETAQRKSHERGVKAEFAVGNAFELDALDRRFDTVIDSGLFHALTDPNRPRYTENLAAVMSPGANLYVLCYSDSHPPGPGPRRITEAEIRETFTTGWQIASIEPTTLDNNIYPNGIPAWIATITRTAATQD